eukprot:6879389-Alexandrium_andersonii.AAC.1
MVLRGPATSPEDRSVQEPLALQPRPHTRGLRSASAARGWLPRSFSRPARSVEQQLRGLGGVLVPDRLL